MRVAVGARFEGDDDAVRAAALHDLREAMPALPTPSHALVTRHERALAQPVLGHRARLARSRAAAAALGLARIGNGYEGSGVPDLIAQADAAVARLVATAPARHAAA